jgi:hypothetical protein
MGATWGEFFGVTIVLFGGAAFLMGQALAQTWRPAWQIAPYSLLLALSNRFFSYALFEGDLTAPGIFLLDWIAIAALAGLGFRLTQARAMTRQYPWLYEPDGVLGWREVAPAADLAPGSPDRR